MPKPYKVKVNDVAEIHETLFKIHTMISFIKYDISHKQIDFETKYDMLEYVTDGILKNINEIIELETDDVLNNLDEMMEWHKNEELFI